MQMNHKLGWMRLAAALCVGMGAVMSTGSAWAVFRCEANGKVSFQDAPCADGQKAREVDVTPTSKGVNPEEGNRQVQRSSSGSAPAVEASKDSSTNPPANCPSAEEMKQLERDAQSVAFKLPIREMKRQQYEAVKERCGG